MNSGAAVKCCAPSIYGNHDFDSDSMYCREQIFFGSPVFSVIFIKNLPSVQPAPFAKPRLRAFRCLRSSFLLINGRSLSGNQWMKIRASTIFTHTVPTG